MTKERDLSRLPESVMESSSSEMPAFIKKHPYLKGNLGTEFPGRLDPQKANLVFYQDGFNNLRVSVKDPTGKEIMSLYLKYDRSSKEITHDASPIGYSLYSAAKWVEEYVKKHFDPNFVAKLPEKEHFEVKTPSKVTIELSNLPNDITKYIASFLDLKSFLNVLQVSKAMYNLNIDSLPQVFDQYRKIEVQKDRENIPQEKYFSPTLMTSRSVSAEPLKDVYGSVLKIINNPLKPNPLEYIFHRNPFKSVKELSFMNDEDKGIKMPKMPKMVESSNIKNPIKSSLKEGLEILKALKESTQHTSSPESQLPVQSEDIADNKSSLDQGEVNIAATNNMFDNGDYPHN